MGAYGEITYTHSFHSANPGTTSHRSQNQTEMKHSPWHANVTYSRSCQYLNSVNKKWKG